MNKLLISVLTLSFVYCNCLAQKATNLKIEKVFLDNSDSTKNCYTIIYPPKLPWNGYIFVVPGFGENAERVLQQTDLPKELALNGILTVIPTFQDGVLSFGVDSLSQQSFANILKEVTSKHKLIDLKFYVGGYSIGGSCTFKYAENPVIKPAAIFAIDPPLDFERMYYSAQRDIRLSKASEPNEENLYIVERLKKEIGGSPNNNQSEYYKFSPYSFSDTTQFAIKKLVKTPIRIYTEPDISWWMKERKADYTSMNSTECSAFINELNRLGNNNALLITTHNKGFRKPDNIKHPHSWSIVNNDELIKWLLKQQ
ncbi:MAG: alpha/beta hydrolase [Bacteroidia bacterium]